MSAYIYIDVSQKQEVIYKNSELKQNLYNSFIIKAVTEKLTEEGKNLDDEIEKFLKRNEIVYLEKYLEENLKDKYCFEYCGGGNSIIRFDGDADAINFIKGYSFRILEKYPDLELYISIVDSKEIETNKYNEKEIWESLENKLDKQKDERQARYRRYTYGIEEIEENEIKEDLNPDDQKKSEDNKKNAIEKARKYIFSKFKASLNLQYINITSELNEYKKPGEGKSYIGVISIDGNKMGEMRHQIEDFHELRSFSEKIDSIYFEAITKAINKYAGKLDEKEKLLVTPILQAGDDICLILEAENAIEITKSIIENIKEISERKEYDLIRKYMKPNSLKYLTACGGVAIARQSYPFFELVKTAERLCHEAKEAIYSTEAENGSFINWEIVQSQVAAQYEYEEYAKIGGLQDEYHIKPLRVDQEELIQDGVFSYNAFSSMVRKIKDKEENKQEISSSFLEGLKKHIYGGIEQYKLYLDMDKESRPKLIKVINEIFSNNLDEYMLYKVGDKKFIYIINDVLEALPFMKIPEGGNNEQV